MSEITHRSSRDEESSVDVVVGVASVFLPRQAGLTDSSRNGV